MTTGEKHMMNDTVRYRTETNQYDNLIVDVPRLYQEKPLAPGSQPHAPTWTRTPFHAFYKSPVLPLRAREYLWHLWRRTGLDQTWFETFRQYWSDVLGGRPLWGVQDFYFLRGLYRIKFQASVIPDTVDPHLHLQAWQQPEVLSQLLHLVYKESVISELAIVRLLRRYRPHWITLLEFGCGTAPVTTTLFDFMQLRPPRRVYLTDLETLAFHYAAYKFRDSAIVIPAALRPEDQFLFDPPEPLDGIFCLTVFEHLNEPLAMAKRFYEHLKPGGLLIFDYLEGVGEGLDTHHAVRQRPAVLDYISRNFEILHGTLAGATASGPLVARKRSAHGA
jgi:SAM-dependent methyltransferase